MSYSMDRAARQAWVDLATKRPFTMYVTWKFIKTDLFENHYQFEHRSIRDFERYIAHVSGRVFGRKAFYDTTKALRHLTFFERESKFGGKTIFHAHSVIEASEENYDRIEKYITGQWKKFKPFPSSPNPHIEKIKSIPSVVSYNAKHAHHDIGFSFNLP